MYKIKQVRTTHDIIVYCYWNKRQQMHAVHAPLVFIQTCENIEIVLSETTLQ